MTRNESDRELVKAALSGEGDAYTKLYQRYHARLKVSLGLKLGEDTDDAVQEAFANAFRNLSRFRGDSAFYTWLYSIARNNWLMHMRKRHGAKRQHITVPIHEEILYKDHDGEPVMMQDPPSRDLSLNGIVDRLTLTKFIAALPEGQRQIYILHEIQGYQHNEIAEKFGISIGASKSQLSRAKTRIARSLQGGGTGRYQRVMKLPATSTRPLKAMGATSAA